MAASIPFQHSASLRVGQSGEHAQSGECFPSAPVRQTEPPLVFQRSILERVGHAFDRAPRGKSTRRNYKAREAAKITQARSVGSTTARRLEGGVADVFLRELHRGPEQHFALVDDDVLEPAE